jgi:NADPH2:quinone reductase
LQKDQKILISGATGSVGHALVQVAKALGGHPIAVVSSSEKAHRAREAGAPSVIDLSSQNLPDTVLGLTDGHGADLALIRLEARC